MGVSDWHYKSYYYKGWFYKYSTVRDDNPPDPSKPWQAWIEKPATQKALKRNPYASRSVTKRLWFAKRVSAQRAAERWYAAHVKKIRVQADLRAKGYIPPGLLCGSCEAKRRDKDDYLCRECRYGA